MKPERSNEELCILAQHGDEQACLQLLKQNRGYIIKQMKILEFGYHPYWQEMIEWGEVGILSSIQDYDPSRGNTFLTFATSQILTELRNFLHSIRMAHMENYYWEDTDENGDETWDWEDLFVVAKREERPLEKMLLNERQDRLLYASMDGLPDLERKCIDYHYGFITGRPAPWSAVARILGVSKAEAKRIEEDALAYLRGCFHVDHVNAFYEVRPEAQQQKALAEKSWEALFDNFAGTRVDTLLAQFDEDE